MGYSTSSGGGPGSDTSAIHDSVDGEISGVTLKASPVSGDLLLIEDSAAAFSKKKITVGSLGGGGGDLQSAYESGNSILVNSDGGSVDLSSTEDAAPNILSISGSGASGWGTGASIVYGLDIEINPTGGTTTNARGINLVMGVGTGTGLTITQNSAVAQAVLLSNTTGINNDCLLITGGQFHMNAGAGRFLFEGIGDFDVDMSNGSGKKVTYTLKDSLIDAFLIREGANAYVAIDTGNETIEFGNVVTNPSYAFLGTGTVFADSGILSVPSGASFKIAGTSLHANWTAANVNTLLNGSNADALHTHAGGGNLQAAYVAGNAIVVSTGEGSVALSNATDDTALLTLDRTFVGGGNALTITMGAGTSEFGIHITAPTSSDAIRVQSGVANFKGNVLLGSSSANSISALGKFNTHLIPAGGGPWDLGASTGSDYWNHLWVDSVKSPPGLTLTLLGAGNGIKYETVSGAFHTFRLSDNTVDAWFLEQGAGGDRYISVDTTNGSEVIRLGSATFSPSVLPALDNTVAIGNGTFRFASVRAVSIVSGDIGFDDDGCVSCGKPFEVGDDIVLRVRAVERNPGVRPVTMTVPMHSDCKAV